MEEKAETGSRLQAEFLSGGGTHAKGRIEQGACTQAFTQTEEPQQGLPTPAQPFIPRQSGGGGSAQLPSQLTVILASAAARERQEKAGKDCWSQSAHWKGQGQLCTAPQEPGIQGSRRSIRQRKMSHGNSKASRAKEVDWKGEEELPSWLAPASSPRTS